MMLGKAYLNRGLAALNLLSVLAGCKTSEEQLAMTKTADVSRYAEFGHDELFARDKEKCDWVFEETGLDWVFANVATPGKGVTIALIDTGYLPNPHIKVGSEVDLGGNGGILIPSETYAKYIPFTNSAEGGNNPLDVYKKPFVANNWGHGISAASVILTPENPNLPFRGIAPHAQVIPFRASHSVFISAGIDKQRELGIKGISDTAEASQATSVARAIYNAVDLGVDIINVSMGGLVDLIRTSELTRDPFNRSHVTFKTSVKMGKGPIKAAVEYAAKQGVVVIAAGGHGPGDGLVLPVPARYDEVIGVAASKEGRKIWEWTFGSEKLEVSSPGTGVCYMRPRELKPTQPVAGSYLQTLATDSFVRQGQGTTFASSTASGIAAIWFGLAKKKYTDKRERAEMFRREFRKAASTPLDTSAKKRDASNYPGLINAKALIEPLLR